MSAAGKKNRSPGFQPGNHWILCDFSGLAIRSQDAKRTWDGLVVHPDWWEPRHPQDFVRSREDNQTAQGLVRTEPANQFIDRETVVVNDPGIPDGTFDNSL